jgi:hypothetical protein
MSTFPLYRTANNYVCTNTSKCLRLGAVSGRQSLLDEQNQDFVHNVLARKDHANKGVNVQEAIDLVQELDPKLTYDQSRFRMTWTLLKGDKSIVKAKTTVAQQTTTKRSNITVNQQFRWYHTYTTALNELR